jgi:hypothetical protein
MSFKRSFLFAFLVAIGTECSSQNMGNGGTTFSSLESAVQPEEFLGRFIEFELADITASASVLQYLHDSDAANRATALASTLRMSASTSEILRIGEEVGKIHKAIISALNLPTNLTDSERANFAIAALELAKVAGNFASLTRNLGATKQVLMTAGAPARVALYAARITPEIAAQLRSDLKAVVQFAHTNGIALSPQIITASELT